LSASDRAVHRDDDGRIVVGWQLLTPLMGPVPVEVVEVLADHGFRVAFVVDQDVAEALAAEAAAEAFGTRSSAGSDRYSGRWCRAARTASMRATGATMLPYCIC
jgi:hypothetical protein